MSNTFILIRVLLFATAGASFYLGWLKSKRNQFYSDTFWLLPLGIFVWGDSLILAPFWMLVAMIWQWVTPHQAWDSYWVFMTVRFAYETVYWINHQVAKKEYRPPLFRYISWVGSQEAGILYQLLTMCAALVSGAMVVIF